MLNGIIYKITCLVNRKCYIGQTFHSAEARWNSHKRGNGSKLLYNDMCEYGTDMFYLEILHQGITCPDLLNNLEALMIASHKSIENGYNRYHKYSGHLLSDLWDHAQEICDLYDNDLKSLQDIASMFDTSKTSIYILLTACGIATREKCYAWKYAEFICYLYERKQKTFAEIAEIFDVSETTISRILRACNIEVRPRSRRKGDLWNHQSEICTFYTDKLMSYQKIADIFGTNHMQIRRIITACGIPLRKYSPRNANNA